jgi:outer membrane immunogenic protein
MKSVRVALSAFGGVFLLASSAMAADLAALPPPVWGLYFGGGVCYDWATLKGEIPTNTPPFNNNNPIPIKATADAPCLTVTAGIDHQFDNMIVAGLFVSYDWQDKRGDVVIPIPSTSAPPTGEFAIDNILTVAGRVGVLATQDTLLYALAGWSWSKFHGFFPAGTLVTSQNIDGLTLGLGVEQRFDPNWSGRLEGRYTDFGDVSFSGATGSITDLSIRAVLTYRP